MPVFPDEVEQTKQYTRLRRYVGANVSIMPDELAEEYFEESLESFPNDTAKMIAYSRVVALRTIRGNAIMLGKYAQGQSEEDLNKVFDRLTLMLEEAIAEVDKVADPIEPTASPFFFGVAQGQRGR